MPEHIRERYREECRGTSIEPLFDDLIQFVRPAIGAELLDTGEVTQTRNRLGGTPDVPSGWEWPNSSDGYLRFLGQVDLAVARTLHGADTLPKAGILSFFFGPHPHGASCWQEMEAARVFLFTGPDLAPAPPPPGLPTPLPATAFALEQLWTTPTDEDHLAARAFYRDLPDDQIEQIGCDLVEVGGCSGAFTLLGYPSREQRGCLQMECEFYRQGYEYGDNPTISERDAAEWDLLAQFHLGYEEVWPQDESCDGFIHYWIRKTDLQVCDFSQICFTWDIS